MQRTNSTRRRLSHVNSLWRITGRPSIILVGVIGLLLIDIRHTFQVGRPDRQHPASGWSPAAATGARSRGRTTTLPWTLGRAVPCLDAAHRGGRNHRRPGRLPRRSDVAALIQLPERTGWQFREGWLAANDNGDLALAYRWVNDTPRSRTSASPAPPMRERHGPFPTRTSIRPEAPSPRRSPGDRSAHWSWRGRTREPRDASAMMSTASVPRWGSHVGVSPLS